MPNETIDGPATSCGIGQPENRLFNGRIENVQTHDTALSPEQMQSQYLSHEGGRLVDDARPFPIQCEYGPNRAPTSTVPWWLAEIAYKHYAKFCGTGQSLERLAQRGGFGRWEFVILLRGDNPYRATWPQECIDWTKL